MTLVAGSLLLATPAQAAPTCTASALTTTCVFSYTGSTEAWIAPPGVVEVSAGVFGAQGGSIANFTTGGLGGRASSSLATTPGEQLLVTVGGRGESVPDCDRRLTPASGGFNGGGAGGGNSSTECRGAGGGGATDIRSGLGALTDRLLVAGGGGGAANGVTSEGHMDGGRGGGLLGETGGPGVSGGIGGDQSGGGSGLLGQGSSGTTPASFLGGAGGGGGGYYGGAGGTEIVPGSGMTSYAGGGGSGFGPAGTAFGTGVRAADGEAVLTFPTVALSNLASSGVSPTAARVSATVDPNGRVGVPFRIVYGTDPASLTSSVPLGTLSGTEPITVSASLSGLRPATTYFFRVEVLGDTTTPGLTSQLTTAPAPATVDPGPDPAAPTSVTPARGNLSTRDRLPGSLAQSGGSDLGFWGLMSLGALTAGGLLLARGRGRSTAQRSRSGRS